MADEVFLLDTNIISNASKRNPHPVVSRWLATQQTVAIPFASLLEIECGIWEKKQTDPGRAAALWKWLDGVLDTRFEYPALTPQVARIMGQMMCCRHLTHLWVSTTEKKRPGLDLMIAATAIVYDMPIATFDSDFRIIDRHFKLRGVYNPAFSMWVVPRVTSDCLKSMSEEEDLHVA